MSARRDVLALSTTNEEGNMAIFFKPSAEAGRESPLSESESDIDFENLEQLFSEALAMNAIPDSHDRTAVAATFGVRATAPGLRKRRRPPAKVPNSTRIGVALGALVLLFGLGVYLEGSASFLKTADAVFGAFNILFTATIAVLGLEDIKFG